MIEMAAKMLASILGLIKGGDTRKASEDLEHMYYDILKEDAAFFRGIPEEKLTEKLLHEHNYTNGHLEILAELFNAEAELCHVQDNKQGCVEYSRKSLILFDFIDKDQKTYSEERISKMKLLRDRMSQ